MGLLVSGQRRWRTRARSHPRGGGPGHERGRLARARGGGACLFDNLLITLKLDRRPFARSFGSPGRPGCGSPCTWTPCERRRSPRPQRGSTARG
eukprot:4677800-Pyramimonas_sp.AAC.1